MSKIVDGIAKDLKSIPEKLKAKTGNVDKKKLLLMNLPYVLAGYFCDKIVWLWRVSPGQDAALRSALWCISKPKTPRSSGMAWSMVLRGGGQQKT